MIQATAKALAQWPEWAKGPIASVGGICPDSEGAISAQVKRFLGPVIALKDQAEKYLTESGLDYTIIRPGGLTSDPPTGNGRLLTDHSTMGSITRADLAALTINCIDDEKTIGKIFHAIDRDKIGIAPM